MFHPFYSNKKYFTYYLVIWLFIAVLYSSILHYSYQLNIWNALLDSFVFNGIFALFGFGLWYTIRYGVYGKLSFFYIVINYLVSATMLVALLLLISNNVLGQIITNHNYHIFLEESVLFRLLGGVLIFTLLILFYYLVVYYRSIQEKNESENKLKLLIKEAELKSLKIQVNPHFLFNSLNSINALTISDPKKAQEMVLKLSDFLRYSVKSHDSEFTNLKKEIENLEKYLGIEAIRFGDKLKFVKQVNHDCDHIEVPFLILQPLIENAVKYSVGQSGDESLINLNCTLDKEYCLISIANTFEGKFIVDSGEGVGLENIRKRLELIYNSKQLIQAFSEDNLFKVILKIPI